MRLRAVLASLAMLGGASGCLITARAHEGLIQPERRHRITELVGCRRVESATTVRVSLLFRLDDDRYWLAEGVRANADRPTGLHGRFSTRDVLADSEDRCVLELYDAHDVMAGRTSRAVRAIVVRVRQGGHIRFPPVDVIVADQNAEQFSLTVPKNPSGAGRITFHALWPVWIALDVATSPVQLLIVADALTKMD